MSRNYKNFTSKRPSHKEITKKIKQAIKLFEEDKWYIADLRKFRKDLKEMGIPDYKPEQDEAIRYVLNKVEADNYIGSRPPKKSFRTDIKNAELFELTCYSGYCEEEIYFKFAIHEKHLVILSLHISNKGKGGSRTW